MHRAVLLAFICSFLFLTDAQSAPVCAASEPPSKFVQEFYDWYTVVALNSTADAAWGIAVEKKSGLFDSRLAQNIKLDLLSQKKSPGEIVGLDFDPFLNTQDPASKYKVIFINKNSQSVLVGVRAAGSPNLKADIIAVVGCLSNRWVFINFRYPGHGDLVEILNRLKESRK